ncbi:MAG: hypothetical protein LBQ67_00780 [Treponema sp.]|jgi:hypothetical protein|nr:hypothetical protein [Treponema sp.]
MDIKEKGALYFGLFFFLVTAGCASPPPGGAPAQSPKPSGSSPAKIPITIQGSLSTVVLAIVERENTIREGETAYTYPGGLAFYFVIYPADRNHTHPTIREAQNFTIDGKNYWRNDSAAIDSYTVIYNERTFEEKEGTLFAKAGIRRSAGALIQKTIICGESLPRQGLVRYSFFFGFDQKLEEFDFQFRLQDLRG